MTEEPSDEPPTFDASMSNTDLSQFLMRDNPEFRDSAIQEAQRRMLSHWLQNNQSLTPAEPMPESFFQGPITR